MLVVFNCKSAPVYLLRTAKFPNQLANQSDSHACFPAFKAWFKRTTQLQTQAQGNTCVNYLNANANTNASADARNGIFFIFLRFHLRLRLNCTRAEMQTQTQTQGETLVLCPSVGLTSSIILGYSIARAYFKCLRLRSTCALPCVWVCICVVDVK